MKGKSGKKIPDVVPEMALFLVIQFLKHEAISFFDRLLLVLTL